MENQNDLIANLQKQLAETQAQLKEMAEKVGKTSNEEVTVVNTNLSETSVEMPIAPLQEADATLRRSVQRISMILQAEKICIMFYDRDTEELRAIPPAIGVEEGALPAFRVPITEGISGEVFTSGNPILYHDATTDSRTLADHVKALGVRNGVCVPLVIEKRDDENRVVERNTIGVLHAFNKRFNEDFNDEDVRLFDRMGKNVASIIANLQLYREVIEEREELLQTFESLSAGLMLVGSDERIAQMNTSAKAIFSVEVSPIGKNFMEVTKSDELKEIIAKAISAAEGTQGEINVVIGGSDRIFQVNAAGVKYEDGRDLGVVLIMSDITELRNIEKMKSSFVAMASHELRTPLTAIKGFSSTLLDGIDDDIYTKEDQREFLGIVVGECDRLRRLIDDLLNTSRIEAGETLAPDYSEFPLVPELDKILKVQQQATKNHTLKANFADNMPALVVGDQDKFAQILTNLMNNAIKYSPGGGDITLHALMDENGQVKIGIQDQGLGIPKEQVNKVFERFHRVDNDDNRKIYGTGLGLFLVRNLVEEVHKGHIWCESEVGVGSTFWFTFPPNIDIEAAKSE